MNSSLLDVGSEGALRYISTVVQATGEQLQAAAAAVSRPRFMSGLPLTGMVGSESVPEDLAALGLINRLGKDYFVSEAGRRMIAHLDATRVRNAIQEPPEPLVLVGSPSDPFFYADILTSLSRLSNVLVVDPFLAATDLRTMVQVGSVDRVLTGIRPVIDRGETRGDTKSRIMSLRITAGIAPGLQVRTTTLVHDRYALPASGRGYMLGASMGSQKVTTLIELSESATRTLLKAHEEIWSVGDPVSPIVSPQPR